MEGLIGAIVILGMAVYVLAGEMYFWKREAEQLRASLYIVQAQWDAAKHLLPADFGRQGDAAIQGSMRWVTRPEITGGTP